MFKISEGITPTATSGRHTDIVHKFDTSVSHYVEGVPTVTYNWFAVILCESSRGPHVGQEMLTLSGTPDFTPFGEFMMSPIHYNSIYIT